MRALLATELLDIWEKGQTKPPVQRALLLLVAACPETSLGELAQLSIGERDGRLMTLREWAFGPQLVSVISCPECGERLELAFEMADIRADHKIEPDQSLSLTKEGYEVEARLPNSHDLAAVANRTDSEANSRFLLERCLLSTQQEGEQLSADQLPEEVVATLLEQMAEADPQADVRLVLTCPACDHHWRALFDIVSYFWDEINTWARRVLHEVHILASLYGWAEADILAMPPRRRQLYLEMIGR